MAEAAIPAARVTPAGAAIPAAVDYREEGAIPGAVEDLPAADAVAAGIQGGLNGPKTAPMAGREPI